MLRRLKKFLIVDGDNPELLRAQYAAFTSQVPLLYFMLMTNMIILAATHFSSAPLYLTLYIPAVLSVVCVVRLIGWWTSRNVVFDHNAAIRRLQASIALSPPIALGFTAWALALFPFGGALAQGHVAFFMAITVIACIFCLMHVRAAAFLVGMTVLVPISIFFITRSDTVFVAIGINMALVTGTLIYLLDKHYSTFITLIESRKALVEKQRETQQLSDENKRLAEIDSLTDLPNRRNFRSEFVRRIHQAETSGGKAAVGIIDLDGFKAVNDAYGHAAGDKLLIEAARRLAKFQAEGIFASRLGGDEFGLLIEGAIDVDHLSQLGERICASLQETYHLNGVTAKVSGSFGIAIYPDNGDNAVQLFERADFALYHAKQHACGHAVIFSQEHHIEITNRSRIDQELKNARLDLELSVLFQPIVDSATCRILGFEALARWDSPALGRVSPAMFIPAAERTGQMGQLTAVLLKKALKAARQWPDGTRLSFNLSAKDIVSRATVDEILSIITESGFPPVNLDMEVTETSVMSNFDLARSHIAILMEQGVGIALDDFGTGHSSLSYVHRLPFRKIKIDRSFVTDIESNLLSRNIIRTIVDLCRNIDCVCVVEGMETAEQVEILRNLGCVIMQGYYFGKPMPLDETAERLAAQNGPHLLPAANRAAEKRSVTA